MKSAEPGALVDWFGDNVVVKATDADVDPAYNTITYDIGDNNEYLKKMYIHSTINQSNV